MEKQTLPAIKIDAKTKSNMESALIKLNERQIVEMSFQDYRRLCYEYMNQSVLTGKEINVKLLRK